MTGQRITRIDACQPMTYRFRLQGHLNPQWTSWFDGLTVTLHETGDTFITGMVADQAALHGLLRKVRDLGLVLLSLYCLEADKEKPLRND